LTSTVDVPGGFLFTNAGATSPGLVGKYVNQSLRGYAPQDDWGQTQPIAGTRIRSSLVVHLGQLRYRSDVGVTGGTDANWTTFPSSGPVTWSSRSTACVLFTRSDEWQPHVD